MMPWVGLAGRSRRVSLELSPRGTHSERVERGLKRVFTFRDEASESSSGSPPSAEAGSFGRDFHRRKLSITSASEGDVPQVHRYSRLDRNGSFYPRRRGSQSEGNPMNSLDYDSPQADLVSSLTQSTGTVDMNRLDPLEKMINISNTTRDALYREKALSVLDDTRLTSMLQNIHACEPEVDMHVIRCACLDKLVLEIMEHSSDRNKLGRVKMVSDAATALAKAVHGLWSRRLKAEYLYLDKKRTHDLIKFGRLRDVSFVPPPSMEFPTHHVWKASQIQATSEPAPTKDFKAGEWWLNLACAHRDGMVGNEFQKPTRGKWGTLVLPLMTGTEEIIREGFKVKYIRESRLISDMHISLISKVGQPMRIVRGHRLHSTYAPRSGCRYDGVWKLTSYRQRLDLETDVLRLELTLEHVKNGDKDTGMESLLKIPDPTQHDEWVLHQKLEMQNILNYFGNKGLEQYKKNLDEERQARDEWHRTLLQRTTSSGQRTAVRFEAIGREVKGTEKNGIAGRGVVIDPKALVNKDM